MIRSMTGFGDAAEKTQGTQYSVEIRSLNNRYLKTMIRLPEDLASLEGVLEAELRKLLSRGSVTLLVKIQRNTTDASQRINEVALQQYLEHLDAIDQKFGQSKNTSIDLTALLTLPGVLQPILDEQAEQDVAKPILVKLTAKACTRLLAMRETEGQQLAKDLKSHLAGILEKLTLIESRSPLVVEEYHQRLSTRVTELLQRAAINANDQDLIREVAIFAERSDISEEVCRIKGHLEQFDQMLNSTDSEPVGRTLDFITQELLREANTIASKCSDALISRAIVEVKGAIDRVKEQVQNIE